MKACLGIERARRPLLSTVVVAPSLVARTRLKLAISLPVDSPNADLLTGSKWHKEILAAEDLCSKSPQRPPHSAPGDRRGPPQSPRKLQAHFD